MWSNPCLFSLSQSLPLLWLYLIFHAFFELYFLIDYSLIRGAIWKRFQKLHPADIELDSLLSWGVGGPVLFLFSCWSEAADLLFGIRVLRGLTIWFFFIWITYLIFPPTFFFIFFLLLALFAIQFSYW